MSDDVTASWIGSRISTLFCLPSSGFHTWHLRWSHPRAPAFIIHIPPRGSCMNRKSRRRIFKDASARAATIRSMPRRREMFALPRRMNPLRCNQRHRTRLHPNASPHGPSETLIAGRTFDCSSATRYANSSLFPDRVLKAWARHYAAVELVYGVP